MVANIKCFRYQARRADGSVVNGVLDAVDVVHLMERLQSISNMELIQCSRQRRRKQLPLRQNMDFIFRLRHSIAAGMPLLDSLQAQATEKNDVAELAAQLASQIEVGASLTESMAGSGMFDKVTVALIACGESAGTLVPVLDGIIESMQHRDELVAQLKQGLIQPIAGLVAVLAVMVTMSIWVAPALASFLESMGQSLPTHTKLLLALLHAPISLWPLWLCLLLLLPGAWYLAQTQPGLRQALDRLLLAVPLFGPLCSAAAFARATSMLRLLYAAGMPLPEAVDKVCNCVGNRALSGALRQAGIGMKEGLSLQESLQRSGFMPPLLLRMVAVGERAGTLEAAFAQLCYLYTREVRENAAKASALMTPVLTAVLGILLAWSAVAFISPVYELVLELPL
ncbi:MAG: type II secretion system F family protein [Candidatus Porifericomitaceae bacterium WSBS_2022_MAG_OTU9]